MRSVKHTYIGGFSGARRPWHLARWRGLIRACREEMVGYSAGGGLPTVSCTASDLPRSVYSGVLWTPAVKFPCCSVVDSSILHSAAAPCLFQTPASEHGAYGVLYAQHPSSISKTWIRRMGSALPASGAAITVRCRRAPLPEWLDSIVPHGARSRGVLRNARLYYLYKCAGIFQTSQSHSCLLLPTSVQERCLRSTHPAPDFSTTQEDIWKRNRSCSIRCVTCSA